ncbi:hypothetical protein Tco_1201836 [Tanacetum coccineum]
MYYEFREAFYRLFDANEGLFKDVLSRNMQNLEKQFSKETLHEKDSNSELRAIKGQFEHFIHSKMFLELSKYYTNASKYYKDFNSYTTMKSQPSGNNNSKHGPNCSMYIQEWHVQEVQSSVTSSGDETSSRIVSDEEIEKKKLEAHYGFMAKIQEVSPDESSSTDTPLEQVQIHDENDVFANVRRHSEQPESINDTYVLEKDDSNVIPDSSNICTNDNQVDQNAAECVDERAALANLIANLTLDTEENKTVLKQLKKANASLTQELKECKTNLDESSRALGEATSSRDSSLIALQTKQTELEKYTALNDLTSDYKILQTKLNETLGLLARKDIDIQEGLKTKTYEISVVNQKHDELTKKSLLNRSQFEGQLKEKTKIPYDTSDPANRFCPNGEETVTLEKESRSKLDKDTVKPYDYTYQNSLYEKRLTTIQA